METRSAQPASPTTMHQQAMAWYRAATLTERLTSWPPRVTLSPSTADERYAEAAKMLELWKAQRPFTTHTLFADRLQMDAMSEQDLLALLAEPPESLQDRLGSPTPPDWVTALSNALETFPASHPDLPQESVSAQFAILEPFYPLLQNSIARLQTAIDALVQEQGLLPFDPHTILAPLLSNLMQRVSLIVNKTLVLELHIARLRGQLQGDTSQERFQYYLHSLSQREYLLPLLEEYSILARQLLISGQFWAENSIAFLQRLCADWQEILTVFAPAQEPGMLTQAVGGVGDTHRGGQSVMILTFASGWRLVYKPRKLAVDAHFQELLGWLNAQGATPPLQLLKLITKENYGWTEFITQRDCVSEDEVRRFYERQGEYLALFYLLEATDLHFENVLAAGEHPLLVDLEALLHPRHSPDDQPTRLAAQALGHSVLHVGLLPWRILADEKNEGVDIGGLIERKGQMSARPVPQWEERWTDEMRLVRKKIEMGASQNCPHLQGQEVRPFDYLESLVTGFTTLYRLLMTKQDEMQATWLPRFAHDEVRFIARNTHLYGVLLNESLHPNLLRDALKRERFLDYLWLDADRLPKLARLIPAERADLLQGDIPLFRTFPESRDLWTSRGECLPEFFKASSLEQVYEHFAQLGEVDLNRQIWLIRASFATTAEAQESVALLAGAHRDTPDQPVQTPDRACFLAHAHAIAERLAASAVQSDGQADWYGLLSSGERKWQVAPAGLDLSNGLPGILLFLAYCGHITGEARYTALAHAGLKTLRVLLQQSQEFFEHMNIGAFTGVGSCLYLFSHLAVLWQDPSLLQEAQKLMQQLPAMIDKDEFFDIESGAAGCIVSLLILHDLAPSDQALLLATRCGDHLLTSAQSMPVGLGWKARQQEVPLTGFSRGAAGFAWSLFRLAAVTGEERFRQTALAALAYERSLFSHERQNWPDLRKRSTSSSQTPLPESSVQEDLHYGMSWSQGAPGIALGRLLALPFLDDPASRAELELAIRTTMGEGIGYCHEQIGRNHSLACGDCGNLEIALLARQIHASALSDPSLERVIAQMMAEVQRHGWVMGTPLNVETPGLMTGLAGIGYQCLRLAEPERVPSILALAPPETQTA